MQTIYLDVYFLINFSVDALALYFAIRATKIKGTLIRLILSAAILSAAACLYTVSFYGSLLGYGILFICFFLGISICAKGLSVQHFVKICVLFLLFLFLIGGVVYYSYGILNNVVEKYNIDINNGAENRGYLFFAAFVLLAIGVIRLFIISFESTKHLDFISLEFTLFNEKHEICAMIDSGNLLRDPLTCTPVVIVKSSALSLPFLLTADRIDSLDFQAKKQIRLIPTNSLGGDKLLYGFYIDRLALYFGRRRREVSLTIAIDNEGGTYGGYDALAPSQITDYVF